MDGSYLSRTVPGIASDRFWSTANKPSKGGSVFCVQAVSFMFSRIGSPYYDSTPTVSAKDNGTYVVPERFFDLPVRPFLPSEDAVP